MTLPSKKSFLLIASVIAAGSAFSPSLSLAQVPPAMAPSELGDDELTMSPEDAIAEAFRMVAALEDDPVVLLAPSGQEKFQHASRLANYILVREPLNKTASYILGRLALLAGRPREAMTAIEAYIGTSERPGPGNADWYAHTLLGEIRMVSYPQLALPEFRKAVELAPDEPKAVIGLAEALLKLNQADEATEAARRAIQLDRGRDPEYRVVLAKALRLSQKYDEAATAAREAIALGEQKAQADTGKLELLKNLEGYYQLHLECVQTLLDMNPGNPEYMLQLVRTWEDKSDLTHLIDYHAVLRALESSHEFESYHPTPELLLEEANLNRIVGRSAKAIEVLERLLEESPGYKPALDMLETLQPKSPTEPADTEEATEPTGGAE